MLKKTQLTSCTLTYNMYLLEDSDIWQVGSSWLDQKYTLEFEYLDGKTLMGQWLTFGFAWFF